MSHRITVSVNIGSGVIDMKVVDQVLKMDRHEACKLIQELAWAVDASAEETDARNQRMRLKTDKLYREIE